MRVFKNRENLLKYILLFVFLLFCGVIPFLTIHIEFRECGGTVARIYSGLFYFPLFIGFLFPIYLTSPSLFAYQKLSRKDKYIFIGLLILLTTGTALSDINQGGVAIWELKRLEHESKIELSNNVRTTLHDFTVNGDSTYLDIDKSTYEDTLNNKISFRNSSITRFTYFISIFIQVFFFILVFLIPGVLLKTYLRTSSKDDIIEYQKAVNSIIFSQIIVFFWLLIKISVDQERSFLYPVNDLANSNFMILLALIFSMSCCSIILLSSFREQLKSILTVLTTLGLSFTFVRDILPKEILVEFFGKHGSWANYLFILMFFSVISFVFSSTENDERTIQTQKNK